jgi:hypothetical protein
MRKLLFGALCLMAIVAFAAPGAAAPADQSAGAEKVVAIGNPNVCILVDGAIGKKTPDTLAKRLPNLIDQTKYTLMPLEKGNDAVQQYKTSNKMVINQFYTEPLHTSDATAIARSLNCDYAVFIRLVHSIPKLDGGLINTRYEVFLTFYVRVISTADGKVVLSKSTVKSGTSNAIYMGSPSLENAYAEALGRILDEVTAVPLAFAPEPAQAPAK